MTGRELVAGLTPGISLCEGMEFIAKQDMLNGIKAGDRFTAPDAILVALGLADVAPTVARPPTPSLDAPRRSPQRRRTPIDATQ